MGHPSLGMSAKSIVGRKAGSGFGDPGCVGVLRLSFAAGTRQKMPLWPRALGAQDDTSDQNRDSKTGWPIFALLWQCGGAYSPFRARLVPAEPGEQRQAPGRGEEHVGGGGAGEAKDEDRGGDHEGGVEAGGVADAADGEEGSKDQEGGGDGRGTRAAQSETPKTE